MISWHSFFVWPWTSHSMFPALSNEENNTICPIYFIELLTILFQSKNVIFSKVAYKLFCVLFQGQLLPKICYPEINNYDLIYILMLWFAALLVLDGIYFGHYRANITGKWRLSFHLLIGALKSSGVMPERPMCWCEPYHRGLLWWFFSAANLPHCAGKLFCTFRKIALNF